MDKQSIGYSSSVKRYNLVSHKKKNIKGILLSEVKEASMKGYTYCRIPVTWHSGKGKIKEMVKWSMVAKGLGSGWIGEV